MNWVLILMMAAYYSGAGGVSVGVVPGFASEAECVAAGKVIEAAKLRELRFVCVQRTMR